MSTPYRATFLEAGPGASVDNITLQDGCWFDTSDHASMMYSPRAIDIAERALDPNGRGWLRCTPNLPILQRTGTTPVGTWAQRGQFWLPELGPGALLRQWSAPLGSTAGGRSTRSWTDEGRAMVSGADSTLVGRRFHERGASAMEYIGGIVVAAILVAGVFLAVSPAGADVRGAVCRSVETILQTEMGCAAGDEEEAAPPDDSDFIPEKCMVHKEGDKYSSVIKIGFVEIGENAGFVRTEYSDGTVTMTATDGGSLGATGGLGVDASWGSGEAAARVDFGGGVEFDSGSTWTFEDADQAEQFREQLDDYLFDQWAMTHPACAMGMCYPRPLLGADPPPVPSTSFSGVKVTGDVQLDLGITVTGGGPSGATQGEMKTHGLAAGISPSSDWVTTSDTKGTPDDESDDTTTYVTDMQYNAEVAGQISLPTGGVGTTRGVSLSITKDADGRITEVKITTLAEVTESNGAGAEGGASKGKGKKKKSGSAGVSGGTTEGDVVVDEVSLEVDPENAGDQQVVTDWLGGTGNHPWPGVLPLTALNASTADPGDPFAQLLFQQATSTSMAYDHISDVKQFGFNVKLGMALGADFTMASEESTITEATRFGAPRSDGTRPVLDYTECVG